MQSDTVARRAKQDQPWGRTYQHPDGRALLAGRFRCPDGRAHRAELLGFAAGVFELGARVGVDEVALLDLDVPARDQLPRVLSLEESTGNSPGPEIDAIAGVLRDFRVDDDVGDLQPPAGLEDTVDLVEDGVLVGHEVNDAVGDQYVDRLVGNG